MSQIYVTARFNAIAADWFDHVLAELKSKKEDQYSLKKHSFRMDSDYAARKVVVPHLYLLSILIFVD